MKSKGAVKFFAIALAVVCLFQLSFTFVSNYWDGKANAYSNKIANRLANGDEAKRKLIFDSVKLHYTDSISRQNVYNLGVHKYTYLAIKERELNLGLDLRGGMHVTLEVSEQKLLKQLSDNDSTPVFNQALENARKEKIRTQRNYITLFYEEIKKLQPNVQLHLFFAKLQNKDNVTFNSSNDDVIKFLRDQNNVALDRTYKVLRTRIDKFGVTQPNTSIDKNTGRIVIELPGANDPVRVRNILKKPAKLEFYESYRLLEVASYLNDADKKIFADEELAKGGKDTSKTAVTAPSAGDPLAAMKADKIKQDSIDAAKKGGAATAKVLTHADSLNPKIKDSLAKLAKNGKSKKAEPKNARQPLFEALSTGRFSDSNSAKRPVIGLVRISDTAKIGAMLRKPDVRDIFPPQLIFAWAAKPEGTSDLLELYTLKGAELPPHEAVLFGDVVTDARQDVDPKQGGYIVDMQMNAKGAADWAGITKRNVGHAVAIVLDGQVQSAPNIIGEIPSGSSQISGNFTAEDAKDLANILTSGKLPVELDIVDEAVVGPSLGKQAITSGLASLLIGVLAITLFMVLYYNRGGWVANLALFINIFFIVGILASLEAALTLPGMAGIVLTLAMAVDANVLIYERIREELGHGKSMRIAISDGFKHALSSIIDGNITTLLIGIILMAFGSGPVYGFAVVLVIGILTSLFTSILVSRLIFDWLLEKDSKINFGNKMTMTLFNNINFDFVGKRRIAYWFSGITIAIGIASLVFQGLNYGVEFKGGRSYVVSFNKNVNIEDVRSNLKTSLTQEPEVKTFGSNDKLNIITAYKAEQNGDEADNEVRSKIIQGLAPLNSGATIESTQKVGSTIAQDIKNSAFSSIFFSLLVVFIYIAIRFKRWQFAFGATVALAHDILFVLTFFSLFRNILPFTDVDQAVVAALLTVAGYSTNDTVVVFDRIREYLRNNKRSPMIPTVNAAINRTLNRTLITSFTVFLVVLILFLFGGHIIRGFSFAMLIGILIGTYSSIFIATPIAVDLQKKSELESTTF
jgi:SecD/SecF fusion protein